MLIRIRNLNVYLKYFVLFSIFCFSYASIHANINLQGQTPHAQFLETRHNFGNIYQGQVLTHSFHFQNTGNGILVLTSLHASCGCVNARSLSENGVTQKNIFRPGEKGVIAVDFDSSQFSGHLSRFVTVETNADEKESSATLTLTANIQQEINLNPALLYLGKISRSSRDTYYIHVTLKTKDIMATSIESDLPFVQATLVPNKQNPQSAKIVVKLKETTSLPIGPFRGTLTLQNTSKYYKSLKIPLMGEVIGHVDASTKFVEFGVVNANHAVSRSLSFRSTDKDFSVKNVKVDLNTFASVKNIDQDDLFEVAKVHRTYKRNGKPVNEYKLNIQLKYPHRLSTTMKRALLIGINVSGNFIIETNDPDYTEVKVPFFGILKQE